MHIIFLFKLLHFHTKINLKILWYFGCFKFQGFVNSSSERQTRLKKTDTKKRVTVDEVFSPIVVTLSPTPPHSSVSKQRRQSRALFAQNIKVMQ